MNQQQIIERMLAPYLVRGKTYPHPLPEALQAWYCYTSDGGHSLLCAVKSLYVPGGDPKGFLVPVPVKSVLRVGHTEQEGYIVVDIPYNSLIGLLTPGEDDEY